MVKRGSKTSGRGTQSRKADADLRLPAAFQQIIDMCRQSDRLRAPGCEAKESPDSNPTKSSGVTALGTIEPPIEIAFRTRGMHFGVDLAIICFLINDEGFGSGADQRPVFVRFHWPDLNRDRRKIRREGAHAVGQISAADEFRMLASHKQDLTESRGCQMPGLGHHLIVIEGDAQNGIVPRKSTVAAIVDALVRQVKGGKQPHGAAEILQCQETRLPGHGLEFLRRFRGEQPLEIRDEVRSLQREVVQNSGERHEINLASRAALANTRGWTSAAGGCIINMHAA